MGTVHLAGVVGALGAGVRAALTLERLAELALRLVKVGLGGFHVRAGLFLGGLGGGGRLGSRLLDGHADLLRHRSTYTASHTQAGFIEPPPGWHPGSDGLHPATTDNDRYGAREGTGSWWSGRAAAGRRPARSVDAADRRGAAVARGPGGPRLPGLRVRQADRARDRRGRARRTAAARAASGGRRSHAGPLRGGDPAGLAAAGRRGGRRAGGPHPAPAAPGRQGPGARRRRPGGA